MGVLATELKPHPSVLGVMWLSKDQEGTLDLTHAREAMIHSPGPVILAV